MHPDEQEANDGFSWSDGSTVNNLAKFWVGAKEPKKGCAALLANNREWFGFPCDQKKLFVCKREK